MLIENNISLWQSTEEKLKLIWKLRRLRIHWYSYLLYIWLLKWSLFKNVFYNIILFILLIWKYCIQSGNYIYFTQRRVLTILKNIQNPDSWDNSAFHKLRFLSIEGVSMSLKLFSDPNFLPCLKIKEENCFHAIW